MLATSWQVGYGANRVKAIVKLGLRSKRRQDLDAFIASSLWCDVIRDQVERNRFGERRDLP